MRGVKTGNHAIGQDDVDSGIEMSTIFRFSFHALPIDVVPGSTQLVEHQFCIGRPVLEDQDSKRCSHGQFPHPVPCSRALLCNG